MWYLALAGLVALILVVVIVSLRPFGTPVYWLVRIAALLGYLSVFTTIVSSAYLVQIVKFFGRPFIKVHHVVAIAGLILITLHPIMVVISGDPVLPLRLDAYGLKKLFGQIAWPLIGFAALAALVRKRLGTNWRLVHYLNYVAFWLATLHANLIGSDLSGSKPGPIVLRIISMAMALTLILVFATVRRRTSKRKG
jgi:DMSO/TMAO reductase YedYZ heme-binding membrane subunit